MVKLLPHYKQINKNCLICRSDFSVFPYRKEARFCSNRCRGKSLKGKRISPNTEFKKGHVSEYGFKGNPRSYGAVHEWLKRHYGKAKKCENCNNKNNYRLEWSNKSGFYKRDIKDWQQLCQGCHRKYDNTNNITKKSYIALLEKKG